MRLERRAPLGGYDRRVGIGEGHGGQPCPFVGRRSVGDGGCVRKGRGEVQQGQRV